jgi:ABC-type branched-subunit amino acid transport system ATPase component
MKIFKLIADVLASDATIVLVEQNASRALAATHLSSALERRFHFSERRRQGSAE